MVIVCPCIFDGLPGITGRAALINGCDTAGYNILTLQHDSVAVYEKKLGVPAGVSFGAFSLNDPSPVLHGRKSMARSDTSLGDLYPVPSILVHLHDNASIFTGILPGDVHTIVYGNSRGEVIALDPATKKARWRNRYTGALYGTPVRGEGIIAFSTLDGIIHGVDERSGRQKWILKTGEPVISEGLVSGDDLYIGTGSHFFRISMKSGQLRWKNSDAEGQLQARPVLSPSGKEILFGVWDRHPYCLSTSTGELSWKWDNGKMQKLYSPGNVVPVISASNAAYALDKSYQTAYNSENLGTDKEIHLYKRYEATFLQHSSIAYLYSSTPMAGPSKSAVESYLQRWSADRPFSALPGRCDVEQCDGQQGWPDAYHH